MDISLHYKEQGSGFPLVLLHGNGDSVGYFDRQMDAFSAHFRVLAPDTRGHGESPRGSAPFTFSQFADDLKGFFDEHGITKAHILGFSDGANTALMFALRYPQCVARLVLNGADLSPKGIRTAFQAPIVFGYGIVSLIALLDKKAIAKKEMLGLMVTQPNIDPKALTTLTVPTLVIVGSKDMVRSAHSRLIADSLQNGRLCVIDGSHFIAATNSDPFNHAVLEFLTEEQTVSKSPSVL